MLNCDRVEDSALGFFSLCWINGGGEMGNGFKRVRDGHGVVTWRK